MIVVAESVVQKKLSHLRYTESKMEFCGSIPKTNRQLLGRVEVGEPEDNIRNEATLSCLSAELHLWRAIPIPPICQADFV